jgi:hypothetical protein
MREDPLIIIGMHRSGTTLLAEIARRLGVFIGIKRGVHEETLFFRRRNQYMYRLAEARWDDPKPMKNFTENRELRLKIATSLKDEFASAKSLWDYWGILGFLRSRVQADFAWGWKDPRNSYTLPVWLDLFPNARVIHLVRNGIDVASSLRRRERRRKANMHLLSHRCLELEGAFSLWAEYINTCLTMMDVLPGGQAMQIQYEGLLTRSHDHVKDVAEFLDIKTSEGAIDRAIREVRPDRAYAFLSNAELIDFYQEKADHPLMIRLGYDRISEQVLP